MCTVRRSGAADNPHDQQALYGEACEPRLVPEFIAVGVEEKGPGSLQVMLPLSGLTAVDLSGKISLFILIEAILIILPLPSSGS